MMTVTGCTRGETLGATRPNAVELERCARADIGKERGEGGFNKNNRLCVHYAIFEGQCKAQGVFSTSFSVKRRVMDRCPSPIRSTSMATAATDCSRRVRVSVSWRG